MEQDFMNVQLSQYWSSTVHTNLPMTGVGIYMEMLNGDEKTFPCNLPPMHILPVRDAIAEFPEINFPAPVWVTGQDQCYGIGTEILCQNTLQDGEHQAGQPFPSPRFFDNADGTIADEFSGLTWLQDMNCIHTTGPYPIPTGAVTWQEALDFIAGVNDGTNSECGAGKTDWRLPNISELNSVLHYGIEGNMPNLPPNHPFFINFTYRFWTSTSDASDPTRAWVVYVPSARMVTLDKSDETSYVWLVRTTTE
jgi:hypothetical protein